MLLEHFYGKMKESKLFLWLILILVFITKSPRKTNYMEIKHNLYKMMNNRQNKLKKRIINFPLNGEEFSFYNLISWKPMHKSQWCLMSSNLMNSKKKPNKTTEGNYICLKMLIRLWKNCTKYVPLSSKLKNLRLLRKKPRIAFSNSKMWRRQLNKWKKRKMILLL